MDARVPKDPKPIQRQMTPKSKQSAGFYSAGFDFEELSDLQTSASSSVQDEIAMLRVVMRRLFDSANNQDLDMEGWGEVLSVLGLSATRLANLLRAEKALTDQSSAVAIALSQAISEVLEELEQ